MKSLKQLPSVFIVFLIIFFSPLSSVSATSPYRVTNFTSNITIEQSTQIKVKETLDVTFNSPKHGIFRIIPVIYRSSDQNINTHLGHISVTDALGKSYKFSTSREGDAIQIKIGDPDKTVTGHFVYIISYTADNVIRRFPDHDELYWNVVGTGWDVPIERVQATVTSPYTKSVRSACYTGLSGSTIADCQIFPDGDTWQITSTAPVMPGADLTFVLGFDPQNQLNFPSASTVFWRDTGIWIVVSLLPGLLFALLWFLHGRDRRFLGDNMYFQSADAKQTSVSPFSREHLPMVYSPIAGLTPAEAGTILDLKVDLADLVAEISELARLGYLKIFKLSVDRIILPDSTDYLFVKTAKILDGKLKDHQKFLLDNLFMTAYTAPVPVLEKYLPKSEVASAKSALVSKMKGKFAGDLDTFRTKLYTNLTAEGYFSGRPDHRKWGGFFTAVILSVAATVYASSRSIDIIFHYGVIFGLVAVFFGLQLGRRTARGHALYRQLVGLKYFVGKGKWRYVIHEKHLFLEEILPLAISLGVINQLTSDMKDLQLQPPQYMSGFVVSDFTSFGRSVGSSLAVSPSGGSRGWSGGSGFSGGSSGGGFGGGGGSSW